jgi:putative heme-binding domain-containing protein
VKLSFHRRCGWSFLWRTTLVICGCLTPPRAEAQDEFPPQIDPGSLAAVIRASEPLTPTEEAEQLFVPAGFQVDLVASEPDIAKPLNLAFDPRRRLWVSHSVEYPFAAPKDAPHRDRISIITDTDGDGIPETASMFADGLNIPIGLCPYGDGVICFSVPNILFIHDTNGDGIEDGREVLYGPFDTTRDTHGMCNGFRRGHDGWIYACHGFNNQSTVSGRDGHTVTMKSGNVFRFRPDGSRIEHFTIGQVNPFGMAIDRFGDIFTADCHTKPITLLLQGGCYDSFGRPHDGLGFVPVVMDHLNGSTAIGGIALGEATSFPAEYQDCTFSGNVMTSRVNRNRIVRNGSSVRVIEETDFLVSADPWFRPVDLVPGPGGALYVADFYNRIIGHYEVDLKHPGRDRKRGRIWRVSWKGDTGRPQSHGRVDAPPISEMPLSQLVDTLDTSNEVRACLALDRINDQFAAESIPALREAFGSGAAAVRWRALPMLQHLGGLNRSILEAGVTDANEVVRVHAYRALAEIRRIDGVDQSAFTPFATALLKNGLIDASPMVRRVAALACSQHLDQSLIAKLIDAWHASADADVHLIHCIRMALRDHLQVEAWFRAVAESLTPQDVVLVGSICPGVDSRFAAEFVVAHIDLLARELPSQLPELIKFAAARIGPESMGQLVAVIREIHSSDKLTQRKLLDSFQVGSSVSTGDVPSIVTEWAEDLTCEFLGIDAPDRIDQLQISPVWSWDYHPHTTNPNNTNCWGTTTRRRCADGVDGAILFSSLEAGERRTGILASASFALPASLHFFVAGHDGFPGEPANHKNVVRLRHAKTGNVLREATVPRNDVARQIMWDLRDLVGTPAILELVDGDDAAAFAWLAVGRFSINELNPDETVANHVAASQLIASHKLASFRPVLVQLLKRGGLDAARRAGFTTAVAELQRDVHLKALSHVVRFTNLPSDLVDRAVAVIVQGDGAAALETITLVARVASTSEQQQLAEQLAGSADGAATVMQLLESGALSLQVLFSTAARSRLEATLSESDKQRLLDWVAQLPDEEQQLAKVIAKVRSQFTREPGELVQGAEIFRRNCSVCHQIKGEGKRVGPNLDGIGNRGLDRLTEDLFAPNRNVDVAFRASTLVLTDGRAIPGLVTDQPDGRIQIVDGKGQITLLAKDEIEDRIDSRLSPMPSNLSQLLTEKEIGHLLAFLLKQTH